MLASSERSACRKPSRPLPRLACDCTHFGPVCTPVQVTHRGLWALAEACAELQHINIGAPVPCCAVLCCAAPCCAVLCGTCAAGAFPQPAYFGQRMPLLPPLPDPTYVPGAVCSISPLYSLSAIPRRQVPPRQGGQPAGAAGAPPVPAPVGLPLPGQLKVAAQMISQGGCVQDSLTARSSKDQAQTAGCKQRNDQD